MDRTSFDALLRKNEDEHIEFKSARSSFSSNDLVEYCVALANERGGRLVLGVSDSKPRRIIGTDAYLADMAKIKEKITAQTRLRVEVEELRFPEGRVLVFHIPSRPIGMPLHINGRYLMRAGSALTGMTPDMIRRILDEAGQDFSAEPCPRAVLGDLDPEAIEQFRRRWADKSGNRNILEIPGEQLLRNAELLVNGNVTYAALVLFGSHESLGRLLGQAEVIFEYRANNAPGPAQQRVDFRQGFFSFYDRLWELINLRNTNQSFQDGFFMWDIKTFNEGAIREAILNAVSHRDYRSGASVFVRQFPERIEIANPGGPPPGITLENILTEQFPRNRRIAETFARCGLVERSGQGMDRIFASCIRETKPEPDFTHTDTDHFWITLHGRIQHPEFLRLLEKIGRERLVSFGSDDFIVLQSIYDNKPVPRRLDYVIDRFLEEGIAEKTTGKKTGVILARKFYAAIGKTGSHTRKKGLDRETNKELLLKHIRESEPQGAKMEEFLQVLPMFDRRLIWSLLRSLMNENRVRVEGVTSNARWHCVEKDKAGV